MLSKVKMISFMKMLEKQLFVDGVACMGKTSCIVKYPNYRATDYCERVIQTPEFLEKHKSIYLQCLYTATFFNTMENAVCVWDRSNISDNIYTLIFETMDDDYIKNETIEKLKLMAPYASELNTVVFVPTTTTHKMDILKKMEERKNGLDLLSYHYVEKQSQMFTEACKLFKWKMYKVPEKMKMFSQDYFKWFAEKLHEEYKVVQYYACYGKDWEVF